MYPDGYIGALETIALPGARHIVPLLRQGLGEQASIIESVDSI